MKLKKYKINELKPALYNPRKELQEDDAEFKKIENSIKEFGYVEPIIINYDKTVIGGHQRLNVLKKLGYDEIDCIEVNVDKEKEKSLNIALNKITGEWDYAKLGDLLLELDAMNSDLLLTGFDEYEIENILAPVDSYIDDLLENEFVEENVKSDEFGCTFIFKKEYEKDLKEFIKENGKEKIVENIIEFIGGDENS